MLSFAFVEAYGQAIQLASVLLQLMLHLPAMRIVATVTYILFIVLINWFFAIFPGVSLFGGSFSPADGMVGFIYLVRDFAQREIKHYVILAMLLGAFISYFMASKTIALASVSAFLVGETIDWLIYTFTKRPLSQRLIWSALISSPFDSTVFLVMIHRLDWLSFTMMTLGKMLGVYLLWGFWKLRQRRRNSNKYIMRLSDDKL